MIIFSLRLENYQFSQPRYIFLIYGNTLHIRILYAFRWCIITSSAFDDYGSNQSTLSNNPLNHEVVLGHTKNLPTAKSLGHSKPARIVQTDLSRNLLQMHKTRSSKSTSETYIIL